MEPTFGGINLEDIKAPDCFYVERKLRERMKIPVFHDDQHGTAIVVGAAVLNALKVVGKDIAQVKLVTSGAGAAALACLGLLVKLGVRRENIWVTDLAGVVYEGPRRTDGRRQGLLRAEDGAAHAGRSDRRRRHLPGPERGRRAQARDGGQMAPQPMIFALANPTPEILPEQVKAVRDDAIIATGRTDYPNQVNNVLCFPYIFRGALDCGATTVTDAMEIAAVHAIAELAQAEQSDVVAAAYAGANLSFGPEYLIPKPFDHRLMMMIAPAVARPRPNPAWRSGPIKDLAAYREKLKNFVYASGTTMKPIFMQARRASTSAWPTPRAKTNACCARCRWWWTKPGPAHADRPAGGDRARIERFGLRLKEGLDYDVVNVELDPRYHDFWTTYHRMTERKGVTVRWPRSRCGAG
jgi:malate dehydrogenase (oxaloacetate-decarboxylating)(NADP+)